MAAIAVRNLAERKLRTALTALAIVLGVMMVAGTYVLTDTIDRSFERIFTQSNEGTDAVITSTEVIAAEDGQVPPFDRAILDRALAVEGVEAAEGAIADPQVSIIGADGEARGGNGAPALGFSVGEPYSDRFDPLTYVEGAAPTADDEVVIDRASADDEGFALGDRVEIAAKHAVGEYTLVGIATLGDVDSFGGATVAVLTLGEAQRITGKQGQFDQINVAAAPGVTPERLASNLSQALPASVTVETGAENVESQQQEIGEFLGFLQAALLVFAGVALFVGAFLIFNTFSITVAQRTREFAMLRTLGASRRQILTSVLIEAFVIGLAAAIIGLAAGVGFSSAIGALFEAVGVDLPSSGNVVAARTVVVALVLGTGLTVVAALAPALRATRVAPIAGLRDGAVPATSVERRRRTVAAIVLAVAGLAMMLLGVFEAIDPALTWVGVGAAATLLGVALLSPQLVPPLAAAVGAPLERARGVPGRLARENSVRNPGRTASTAAALMIGLALVSFVAMFAAGLKGSINSAIDEGVAADLIVSNQDGFSDIPVAGVDTIRAVPGVETATPARYTQSRVEGAGEGFLTLVEPATAAQTLTLEWDQGSEGLLASLGPTEAVADEGWSSEHGFAVGDTFAARTASGEVIRYEITGTFTDNTDFFGDYIASDANAGAYGEGRNVTNVFVNVEPGPAVENVRLAVEDRLDAEFPTAKVEDREMWKDSIAAQLDALLGIVYALLALAVVVSLFGIVNTLALSIHERTRELGLLRAIGTSRSQVRRMVRYEAVITALIGAVLGAILGLVFAVVASRPLADEGFTLSIPVATLVVMLVLAMAAGVIAAIGPARRASRLDVLEALAYE